MLSAYIGWHGGATAQERSETAQLWGLDHFSVWDELAHCVQPNQVRWLQCTEASCSRCAAGHGGYTFRWFDWRWKKVYMELRRPGSWRPGESEIEQ